MVQIGDVLDVTVTNVQPYGLFVSANGLPGLILIPELSWGRISHPSEIADIGESIQCKVIHLPPDQSSDSPQFTASVRDLHPELNPWRDPDVYAVGNRFSGPVVMRRSYGYFVQHPNNALVLIHADDVPPNTTLPDGTSVTVLITDCDIVGKKVRGRLLEIGPLL